LQFAGTRGIYCEQHLTNRIRSGKLLVFQPIKIINAIVSFLITVIRYAINNKSHFGGPFHQYIQCYPESGSLGSCLSELLMLENSELQSRQRLRLAEASMTVTAVTRGKTITLFLIGPQ
jgi:hypothetical protein